MAIMRWVEVDPITGDRAFKESSGALSESYDDMRRRVEAVGRIFVPLSDSMLLERDVDGMTEADVANLPAPDQTVVRLPPANEVDYDFASGWFVPRPRPSYEEAMRKTKAELVADMVARGAPLAWATITVDAREGEYDAYDPLEGVHPYGTSDEDIAQAGIVAAEARAARRAG